MQLSGTISPFYYFNGRWIDGNTSWCGTQFIGRIWYI